MVAQNKVNKKKMILSAEMEKVVFTLSSVKSSKQNLKTTKNLKLCYVKLAVVLN